MTDQEVLDNLAKTGDKEIKLFAARNVATSPETLHWLAKNAGDEVAAVASANPTFALIFMSPDDREILRHREKFLKFAEDKYAAIELARLAASTEVTAERKKLESFKMRVAARKF